MLKFRNCLIACTLGVAVCLMALPSCDKSTYTEELDTLRGIWGKALLYNEFGSRESDNSNISIQVRCIDTVDQSPLTIFDTSYYITTDTKGNWELYKPEGGWYFLEFSKNDYCKTTVYAHHYDTSRADTLETVYLAKPTQGSVEIDSVSIKDDVLSIYRTLYFTANYSSYGLATWYFFGKSASVSPEDYEYAYVSGSATGKGNSSQNGVVYKPLDKLFENGFQEGETVYMRAYCDNARAVSYQVGEEEWVFPNILDGSKVFSFEIPISEE